MKTEYEVKFADIDFDAIRRKLKLAGAKLVTPMRLMKRTIIETPEIKERNAFLRVRDEGDKTTLTYKQFDNLSVDGAKEHEITISDFDTTLNILNICGLKSRSIQESKRETWILDGVNIELDEWPWLKPYIEIEGESESAIRRAAGDLGLKWEDAVFGDVMVVYRRQYPHLSYLNKVSEIAEVRFNSPLPKLLKTDN